MPRVTTRKFVEQLTLANVRDADRGPKISDDIQLVYIVDDISQLIAPIPGIKAYFHARVTGIAALFAGMDSFVIRNPWQLFSIRNNSANISLFLIGDERLDIPGAPGGPTFETGGNSISVLRSGTATAAPTVFIVVPAATTLDFGTKPLDVPVGQGIKWTNEVANTDFDGQIIWQETPAVPETSG